MRWIEVMGGEEPGGSAANVCVSFREVNRRREKERGTNTKHVGEERPFSRTEFDQADLLCGPLCKPLRDEPNRQQLHEQPCQSIFPNLIFHLHNEEREGMMTDFTEYLRDLGGGDEIPLRAKDFSGGVVPERRMGETEGHIPRNRQRTMRLRFSSSVC